MARDSARIAWYSTQIYRVEFPLHNDVHSLALEGLLKLKLDNLGVTHEPQPARALVPQAGPKPAAASELAPQACT